MIQAMGGECQCCGYKQCKEELVFHHLDPSTKHFNLSSWKVVKWSTLVKELKKCILVCKRCHAEIHSGVRIIPTSAKKFDENYTTYEQPKTSITKVCQYCGNKFECVKSQQQRRKHCSNYCRAKSKEKVDWDSINIAKELTTKSMLQLSKELGVSFNAVKKQYKKRKY